LKKAYQLLATLSFSVFSLNLSAQFVTIPDANFATYLHTVVPNAMTGSQIDTTNASVLNLTSINVDELGITNLYGIQFFKNLVKLYCGNGSPSNDSNHITSLPNLPSTLDTLYCGGNQITNLPNLPNGLHFLWCYYNQLTSLPVLPGSLIDLSCEGNQLTNLPALPGSLIGLICQDNKLTSLPALPLGLITLDCSSNQLTSLPALPGTLLQLICSHNQLTSISSFPAALTDLFCDSNNISCFPVFPSTLIYSPSISFNISGNPFTCLPNYVLAMDAGTLAYPLCLPGNSNGCSSASGIVGYTYKDMNSDCSRDNGDLNLVNVPMQIYDNSNNLLGQTFTTVNGVFDFWDTNGTYKVIVDTTGMPFIPQCAHPGIDSSVTVASLDTAINFSLTCKGVDLGVQSIVPLGSVFPGLQDSLIIVAGDMSHWFNLNCASGDTGTVFINVSGPVTYLRPGTGALTPTSVNGNVFKYTITDYSTLNNTKAFNLIFSTDTTAQAGDTICVTATVTPLADNNPTNNIYQYCYQVNNSLDPNNKTVYPTNVAPDYNGWLTYTIHFQNTGTAAAQNILVADTLSSYLDVKTFQLLNYSNQNSVSLTGNVLNIRFNNINLPDSAANDTGSIGFVQYRIKPKGNLPLGTDIKNTGYIFFDYNPAVVTNTTQNNFNVTTSVNTIVAGTVSSKVFPDPNKGEFTLQLPVNSGQWSEIEIYNDLGEVVYSSSLNSASSHISLPNKAPGLYLYRVISNNGKLISTGKIAVE